MPPLLTAITIEFPFLALWLAVLYRLDRRWKEKRTGHVIFVMVIAGGMSVLPAWASYFINPFWFSWRSSFLFNFLVVGLAEEFVKFVTFIVMARALNSIREPQDGIIQGAAVGIGFTLVENVLYGLWFTPSVTLMRSLLIGFHGLAGALWGFAWAGAVYENTGDKKRKVYRQAFLAFIPVALLHSLYNTFSDIAIDFEMLLLFLILFEALLLFVAVRGYKWMAARSPYHRFAFSDCQRAIDIIQRGLIRNPHSTLLRRRLLIYSVAAGNYNEVIEDLEKLADRRQESAQIRGFLGLAYMGAGYERTGSELLESIASELPERRLSALERLLYDVVQDDDLGRRVRRVLNPPIRALDQWEARRAYLQEWNAARVVHSKPGTRYGSGAPRVFR